MDGRKIQQILKVSGQQIHRAEWMDEWIRQSKPGEIRTYAEAAHEWELMVAHQRLMGKEGE